MRCAAYVLVRPSTVRVGTVTVCSVVHGPWGAAATSRRTAVPFQSLAFTTESHIPSINRGCIGLVVLFALVSIGMARARLVTHALPLQYVG